MISQPDWWANYDLATGSCCDQLRQAAAYYLMIKQQYQQYPKATITLTGQSLGGSLAALIGVFFNVKAVTFDQAPFSNSATVAIREDLIDYLTTPQGGNPALYSRENFQLLAPELFTFTNLATRAGLVTNTYVVGESLHEPYMLGLRDNFIGQQIPLPHQFVGVAPADLHATATIALFIMKPEFRELSAQLKSLYAMMVDENLFYHYASDNSGIANFQE